MSPRPWLLVPACACVLVMALVAAHWSPVTGFTELERFGASFGPRRIPPVAELPVATVPGRGYDGQFYAQLAVSPDIRDPAVSAAMDSPAYRAQRILLSLTAHALGRGRPWSVLQAFALQNAAIWLALGWILVRELEANPDKGSAAVWLACMLGVGSLDCIRMSLTDLGMLLFLAIAVRAARARSPLGIGALALACLTRETAILGGAVLWRPAGGGRREWLRLAIRWVAAALPLLGWAAWLALRAPGPRPPLRGNFDWPGLALARHCAGWAAALARGEAGSREIFGLLGAAGLAWQSVRLLARPRWHDPWWRAGSAFALLFWFLGDDVWDGYWAAARVVLPMTFAFNLTLPRGRGFWPGLATNLPLVLHGVLRLVP